MIDKNPEENLGPEEQDAGRQAGVSGEQVLNNLKSKDHKVRYDAICALSQVKNKRVVNLLINCLKDPVWNNRSAAANSLIEIGVLSAEPLISVLNTENEDVRFWSIRILGNIGGEGVPHLAKLLVNPDRDLRLHVVRSLGLSMDPAIVDPLIMSLGDADWSVRKHAAEGLVKIGMPAIQKLQKAFQENLADSMGNDDICYWAVKVLGQILRKDALPAFVGLLKNPDKNIRFYAVGGIGETRCEDAVDPLISSLADPSWLVRRHAFEMLEVIGETAINKLKQAYFQGDDDTKYWAVRLIAKILKGNSIEVLKKMLNTQEKEIRYFIVTALGETDDTRAIGPLIECFKDYFWHIRKKASDMIARMKFRAIPAISNAISSDSEDVRYWSVQTLGMIGGEAMETLLKLRTHPDKRMRLFTVKALGNLQNSSVIEPLIDSLGDTSWPVRTSAAENLEKIGEYAIRPLIKAIGSENADISFWAQKILQNFGDKAVQTLINSLSDKSDKYRQHTIKALGKIGTRHSVKPLLEILASGIIEECDVVLESLSGLKNTALISFLLETLATTDDANIITWVSQILSKVGEEAKPVLFKALKHQDTAVRVWACKLLGGYEGDDILKALWIAMQDPEPSIRTQAVKSVGEIGQGLSVIPYVTRLIKDPETMVRFESYRLLGKIGAPTSIMPMLQAFQSESEPDQKMIMDIFKDIEATNFMMGLVATLETAPVEMHPLILQLLEKICDSPVRRDLLIKNFEYASAGAIYWIIQVLVKFDEEPIVDAFIKLLENPEVSDAAVGALLKYVKSTNFVIREKVNASLTKGGLSLIRPLIKNIPKNDDLIKMNATNIIESMGDEIKPILEEIAADKAFPNHTIAIELLTSMSRTVHSGGTKKWSAPPTAKDKASKISEDLEREMAKTQIKK